MHRLKTYTGELPEDIRIFEKISDGLKNQGNAGALLHLGTYLGEIFITSTKQAKEFPKVNLLIFGKGVLKNGIQGDILDKTER